MNSEVPAATPEPLPAATPAPDEHDEDAEGDALGRDPRVVGPHPQREVLGRVLGVVALEVVVDELVDLLGLQGFVVAGRHQRLAAG